MLHFAEGSPTAAIDQERSRELIRKLLTSLGQQEQDAMQGGLSQR